MAMYDNLLVRSLAARTEVLHAPLGSINETHYELAQRNLAHFALATTLEDATASTYSGAPLFWTNFELATNGSNIDYNHHPPHRGQRLTEEELAWLAARNVWDLRLWDSLRRRSTRSR